MNYGDPNYRGASRNSPSPPEGGPLGYSSEDMSVPRPFRTSSANSSMHSSGGEDSSSDLRGPSSNGGHNPYGYSTPSLPRYQSQQQLSQPSPLNPSAVRGGSYGPNGGQQQRDGASSSNASSRFSSYGYQGQAGNNAHPLSNAMYMDSSPTLAGSEVMSPDQEKMRLGAADQLGEYIQPHRADTALQTGGNAFGGRRGPLKATGFTALYRGWSGATLADSGKDERHIKLPRLGYLDGIKFVAAWVALNGTLFDAVLGDNDYAFIQRDSPLYITRSFGLATTFLLLLSGRSLITPLWDVPSPSPNNSMSATAIKPNSALISWARLTRAMLVRTFRFILPVITIVALQWGLSSAGRTSNCNAVGMDEPYWGLVSSFSGFCTLVFDLFTSYESNTLAGQTFAGNLWTNAWFFQSSFAVYVIHMMLGNLSSNRYWIYSLIAFFSWTTYNYFFVAVIGLMIADMHAHGHLHRIRTKWPMWQRLTLHAFLIIVACVSQFVPIIRDNVNSGLAVINVQNHPELTFCDALFASCWLFAIETSGIAQAILGNIFMRTMGKFAPGLYLLAPAITFTLVPDLALTLHNNGSTASSVLGVSWLVLFFVTLVVAALFHFVVELPSKMLGEIVCEMLESSEPTPLVGEVKQAGGKLLKKNVGGGANKGAAPAAGSKPVLV